MYNRIGIIFFILLGILVLFVQCKQSPPPPIPIYEPKGDFSFSGYQWRYKNAASPVGPGPNRFSGTNDFAWVDADGSLHLKIAKKNNNWTCSEVISTRVFGYGTYIFTSMSDISTFNERVVFGGFTWDTYSFVEQGNSEIDIEFSKWNNPNDTNLITYSAQPVWFTATGPYLERTTHAKVAKKYLTKPMTHIFKWTADSVKWETYEGEIYPGSNKISEWKFDKNNLPRKKIEGNLVSKDIIIPGPSDSTNFRFNFWLLDGKNPSNNADHEIIIRNFKYYPI